MFLLLPLSHAIQRHHFIVGKKVFFTSVVFVCHAVKEKESSCVSVSSFSHRFKGDF
jgi:hypothetical protein